MRARAALLTKKIQCEVREILLSKKPQQLFKVSPKGTVPVLILPDGKVLEESLDIMHWAMREEKPLSEEATSLIYKNDTEFKINLDKYKYSGRESEERKQDHRNLALIFLNELEKKLQTSSFLFGDEMTFADLAILPFVRQFSLVEPEWFAACGLQKMNIWLRNWLDAPLHAAIMQKYPLWSPDNASNVFLF